ncbi:MAG: hypothetical protein FRX49_07711 [Trebouxia sp. A1-2]|nr:MAG: hypothetical protein FRX49_07711 [Trebouxia sp. A1-2]
MEKTLIEAGLGDAAGVPSSRPLAKASKSSISSSSSSSVSRLVSSFTSCSGRCAMALLRRLVPLKWLLCFFSISASASSRLMATRLGGGLKLYQAARGKAVKVSCSLTRRK